MNLNHNQPSPVIGMEEDKRRTFIRVLLGVEHDAGEIIKAAKAKRIAKLKEAKQESEIEVARLREEFELAFQKADTKSTGDFGANLKKLEEDAETKINSLKLAAEKVRDDLALKLLQQVMAVRL